MRLREGYKAALPIKRAEMPVGRQSICIAQPPPAHPSHTTRSAAPKMPSLRKSLTRRVSKPLRALKVFSPKSKSKGQDAGSQTSASETASVASSSPPAEHTIAKVVVVQAQIVDEVQSPVQVEEKQHEAARRSSHDQLDSAPQSGPQNVSSEPQPTAEITSPIIEPSSQPPAAPEVDISKPSDVSNADDNVSPISPEPSKDATPSTAEEIDGTTGVRNEEQALVLETVESTPAVDAVEKDVEIVVVEQSTTSVPDESNSHEVQPLSESLEFVVVNDDDASPPPPVTVVELFDEKAKDMDVPAMEEQQVSSSTAAVSPLAGDAMLLDPVADINPFIEDVSTSPSTENIASSADKPSEPSPLSSPDVSPEASTSVPAHPLSETPSTPLNVNKEVPPSPPAASDSGSDEPAPVVHAPGITLPTLFLPIPNVRLLDSILHLTWWLTAKVTAFSFWRVSRPTR